MKNEEKKKQILNTLAQCTKNLRGDKSQLRLCNENNISTAILSTLERGLKDPQLTTVFKLAEAFGIKPSEFVKLIEQDLTEDFTLIEI